MKQIRSFMQWLWKVICKLFWVLSLVPLILDYIVTYIPKTIVPPVIENFIQNGGTWTLTILFAFVGFSISAFLVHLDTIQQIEESQKRIREFEEKQPSLLVGFQDEDQRLVSEAQITLKAAPDLPNFDEMVETKRWELLEKKNQKVASKQLNFQKGLFVVDPEYDKRVEEYLKRYQQYERTKYLKDRLQDRVRWLCPAVKNVGGSPATDIKIEFVMPREYVYPDKEESMLYAFRDEDLYSPPKEPDILVFSGLPSFRDFDPILNPSVLLADPLGDATTPPGGNCDGPIYSERTGEKVLTYLVRKLIPGDEEVDFDSMMFWLVDVQKSSRWDIEVRMYASEFSTPVERAVAINIVVQGNT